MVRHLRKIAFSYFKNKGEKMIERIREWKSNADCACILTRSRGVKPVWITHFLYFIYLDIKDLFKRKI